VKFRESKPEDQEEAEKAFQLLLDLITHHQRQIEPSLWVGAMIGALADNYEKSGFPFKYFKKEMEEAVGHYKY
jgi:hypothetical protein